MFYLCPFCAVLLFLLHILLSFPLITLVFFLSLFTSFFLLNFILFFLFSGSFAPSWFHSIFSFCQREERRSLDLTTNSVRGFFFSSLPCCFSLSLFSFYFFVVSYLRACVSIYLKVETPPRLLLIALRHVHKRYIECIHTLRTLSGKLFFYETKQNNKCI